MGIVRVKEFEEEFEKEEIEIYALLRKVPNGAAVYSEGLSQASCLYGGYRRLQNRGAGSA